MTTFTARQLLQIAANDPANIIGTSLNAPEYEFRDNSGPGFYSLDGVSSIGTDIFVFQNQLDTVLFVHPDNANDFLQITDEPHVSGNLYMSIVLSPGAQPPSPPPPPPPGPVLGIVTADSDKFEGNSGATAFTFTATRTGSPTGTFSATWTVSGLSVNGGALASATDFVNGTFPTGTVTFGPNEGAKTVTVNVQGDLAFEPDENFVVTLSNPTGGATIDPQHPNAIGRIANDDVATTLSIAPLSAVKPEGNSGTTPFTFTVTRTGDTSITSTATWTVTPGVTPPANATDFGGAFPFGTVTLAPGETTKTVTVNVKGDTAYEGNEGFDVTLSNPGNASIDAAHGTAHGVIDNDDAAPVIGVAKYDSEKPEGNSGTTPFTFLVTRTGDAGTTNSVTWTVSGGASPASSGADFAGGSFPSGSVTFGPGDTTKPVTIYVQGDVSNEPNENLLISLSNPTGGATLDALKTTADGIIINDDGPPIVGITPLNADLSEGSNGLNTTLFTFLLTRSGDTTGTNSVTWSAVSGASPSADGLDFGGGNFPTGTVTFNPGETSITVAVPVVADFLVEPDENFKVMLTNPTGGASVDSFHASANAVIRNDDSASPSSIVLAITPLDANKPEGNSGSTPFSFLVTRSGDTTVPAGADWTIPGGTDPSSDGLDFVGGSFPSGSVGFAAGEIAKVITVNVQGDTTVEQNENFTVALTASTRGATVAPLFSVATGTILNDDGASLFAISTVDANKAEGQSGATPFTFAITRTGDASTPASVGWATSPATTVNFPVQTFSASSDDFVGGAFPSGTVTFNAGETTKFVRVNVQGDYAPEHDDLFKITIQNPTGGGTVDSLHSSVTGQIKNDDPAAEPGLFLVATDAVKSEGNTGATPFTFTVSRNTVDKSDAVSVGWFVSAGASPGVDGTDFVGGTLPNGTVTLAANQASQSFTVNVQGDTVYENNGTAENFVVTLISPSGIGIVAFQDSAAGQILNDDPRPNQAPTDITGTLSVNEFAANGTLAGTVTAQDADSNSFTYALVNDANGRFAINNAGQVTVKNGLLLDFEQNATNLITIRATDSGNLFLDKNVFVTIGDVNPENIIGDGADNTFMGGALADIMNGGGGNDTLYGRGGDDTFDGSTGSDIMLGGPGNDVYFVDTPNDSVVENVGEGNDTVLSPVDFTLPANVENLILQGTGDRQGYGNSLSNTIYGNSGSNVLNGNGGADVMIGGAGNDFYIVDDAGDQVSENPNEGNDTVFSTVNFTLSAEVENLVLQGTAGLQGYGNALANTIFGNSGNNTLNGFGGADVMIGGAGSDVYFVDNPGDSVVENPNEGNDAVFSTIHLTLPANVEALVLQGNADLQGYGNALDDAMFGNAGSNVLDGGAGADTMFGGAGNDFYYVDNVADVVSENAAEGNDTVFSMVSITLGANVENLVLQGGADLQAYGNALANTLFGNGGSNVLNGNGGADSMFGGAGNDFYFIDDINDVTVENPGEGNDTVFATISCNLAGNIENLMMQGSADLQGYGNALANTMFGNTGNNVLNGNGGADTMIGGAGDDFYTVDTTNDLVSENAGEGNDTVFSTIDYNLSANVEFLVLQGSADLQGYGNTFANVIYGNAGGNILDGRAGGDAMYGGAGNDFYYVDNISDLIIENPGEGNDTVFATINYALAANLETLILQGSADLQGYGGAGSNTIFGNSGANLIDGGAGADVLQGFGGNDVFVFRAGEANGDTVVDFTGNGASPGDSMQFAGYGAGATFTQIDAAHWQVNYNAGTSHDVITFNNLPAIHATDFTFL